MVHEAWKTVQRVLITQAGLRTNAADLGESLQRTSLCEPLWSLAVPIERLQQAIPQADLVLLCTPEASQTALALPNIAEILVHQAASAPEVSQSDKALDLVDMLRSEKFDAAIVFSNAQTSPYALAYLCYLAGIPIRVGQSQEFGGGVLTEWVTQSGADSHPIELLDAIGIGT